MRAFTLDHVSDRVLDDGTLAAASHESDALATLLLHLAESEARKRHAPAGYPSMLAYCVGKLGLAEDSAIKRLRVARTARQFPAIFEAIADHRLHLTAVLLLKPYLCRENVDELIAAAERRSKAEIEQMLAERFPRTETFAWIEGDATSSESRVVAPEPPHKSLEVAPEPVTPSTMRAAPAAKSLPPKSKLAPIAPGRFLLQVCLGDGARKKLQRLQDHLSHRIPPSELAEVLERTFEIALGQLDRKKLAATDKPVPRRRSANKRTIPAHVRREVWKRDGGRCTFVSEGGHRCESRGGLEFDHAHPVARGGEATVENVRVLCRTHNQLQAERLFGAGFMKEKRENARGKNRAPVDPRPETQPATHSPSAADERAKDLIAGLRSLGFRGEHARRAAESCASAPDTSLEDAMKAALRFLSPKVGVRRIAADGVGTTV